MSRFKENWTVVFYADRNDMFYFLIDFYGLLVRIHNIREWNNGGVPQKSAGIPAVELKRCLTTASPSLWRALPHLPQARVKLL